MKRKVLSLLLATTMVMSIGMTASAAGGDLESAATGGEITADSTLDKPIYKVTVPTTLTFAIDPFEQAGGSQIYSKDLTIINKSNVAVKMDVSVAVTDKAGDDVAFVTSEADVSEANENKNLFFAVEVAKTAVETKAEADFGENDDVPVFKATDGSYDVADNGTDDVAVKRQNVTGLTCTYGDETVKVAATDEVAAELTFALAGAKYITYNDGSDDVTEYMQTADSNAGSAAFRFYGKVNTTSNWADDELTATVTYSFFGLTATNYDETETAADAQGYVVPEVPASFSASEAVGVINLVKGTGDSALKEIKSITIPNGGAPYDGFNAFENLWEAATVNETTITFDSAFIAFYAGQGDVTATITYDTETETNKIATVVVKTPAGE